jgi:ubiquinone biosynthesis protein UbiJ
MYVKQFTPPVPDLATLHPVRLIAAAFNLLTVQQPWAAERLARYAGKTIRIALGGFAVTLTIDVEGHLTQSDDAVVPDVILEVIAEKLSIASIFSSRSQADMAELINISGQAALAQVVSDLARDLRPDPEDAMAHFFGDIPARKLMQGARGLAQTLGTITQGLTQNLAEYFAEETNTLAGLPLLAMHRHRQATLADRIDTLNARHSNLMARLDRLDAKRRSA